MLNVVEVQDRFIEWLDSKLPIPLYEEGVPDAETVRKVDGKIVPYAAVQPGMPQKMAQGRGFSGVRANDFSFPFQVQVVAADAAVARRIACGPLFDAALGFSDDWTGEMDQRPGGQLYSITTSTGATECYQYATNWAVTVQLHEID